jgi:hypothetical protein
MRGSHPELPNCRRRGLTASTVSLAACALLALTVTTRGAQAADRGLGPIDTYFVTQTSLGTPFQVDSGRLAEAQRQFVPMRD